MLEFFELLQLKKEGKEKNKVESKRGKCLIHIIHIYVVSMDTATFVSVARTKFKESKICLTQQQSNESTQKK